MNSVFDEVFPNVPALLQRPLSPSVAPETLAFETALTDIFSVKEAIAVSSGTAAIHCALAALGIGPGDEVLVPALSVIMSVVPVLYQQARPVFADSEPGRVDFDYEDLERKISLKTKAIIPVYLWGCSYHMDRLIHFADQYRLAVIEDACQAHGSQWQGAYLGAWGDIGCFSMRDGKLLSTGEGGFLLTNDHSLAERCRAFRSHWANTHDLEQSYRQIGQNYRLSEIQAWLGCKQVGDLDAILAQRYWQSTYLLTGLAGVPGLEPYRYAQQEKSNLFSPVFLLSEGYAEKGIARMLAERGIPNSVGSFGLKPAHQWSVFSACTPRTLTTPHAQQFLSRTLAVSLLPQYTEEDLDRIIMTIKTTIAEGT